TDGSGTNPADVAAAMLDSKSCQMLEAFRIKRVERRGVADGEKPVRIAAPFPELMGPVIEAIDDRGCVSAGWLRSVHGTDGIQQPVAGPGKPTVSETVGDHAAHARGASVR